MAIEQVVTAPRSPWQNAYVERIIGSIRRECLDHVVVFTERHLRRVLSAYFEYHHRSRTHLSLRKDCPEPRPIQPSSAGTIVAFPKVGGLHHRYERCAARTAASVTCAAGSLLRRPALRYRVARSTAPDARSPRRERAALWSMPNVVGRAPHWQSASIARWPFEQGQLLIEAPVVKDPFKSRPIPYNKSLSA